MNSLSDLYREALDFAAKAHLHQKMPASQLPYFLHLTEVMTEMIIALQKRPDLDEKLGILCAILHDTLEDTQATFDQVKELFGVSVAEGVQALSKNENLAKEEQMKDSLERIKLQKPEVWCVKLADRIVNLKEPPSYWNKSKIHAYWEEAKLIKSCLGEADAYLSDRLEEKITAYQSWF